MAKVCKKCRDADRGRFELKFESHTPEADTWKCPRCGHLLRINHPNPPPE